MIRFVLATALVLAACSSSAAGTTTTTMTTTPTCPASTPLICSGTPYCCESNSPYLCGGKCWQSLPTAAECNAASVVCSAPTGGGGTSSGACQSGSYCYEWNCNGDSECLATNPNGTATGAVGQANEVSCNELITFGQKFWGIPPATQSCTLTP